jgi:hypothetical protein
MKTSLLYLVPACALLGACNTMPHYFTSTERTVEMIKVVDLKTDAGTAAMSRAAIAGLGKHTVDIESDMPAPMTADVPGTPGRFRIAAGDAKKAPDCAGAVWTARAQHSMSGSDSVHLYGCLYKYQAGYQLDTFATFTKTEGGWMQLPRYVRSKFSGTPEGWVNDAVLAMVQSMEVAASSKATYIEGEPGTAATATTSKP